MKMFNVTVPPILKWQQIVLLIAVLTAVARSITPLSSRMLGLLVWKLQGRIQGSETFFKRMMLVVLHKFL